MVHTYREYFNRNFTREKYANFLHLLEKDYPPVPIRFAETPVFIPEDLKNQLIAAGEEIIRLIKQPGFKELTASAIPKDWIVPNENDHPHFLAFDFGICKDEQGRLVPRLIEMQGFPSLFAFQLHLADTYKEAFELNKLADFSPFFHGMDQQTYISLLKKVILGPFAPQEVALMDIDAPNQKTAIDFFVTAKHLGIKILSLTDIFSENGQLFYQEQDEKVRLRRIYNRLIFDEVSTQQELFKTSFDPREPLDVEWITHPNWFYRISKFTMPFLKNEFVPETQFLNALETIPADLENYVLKPLFSFAGMGVIIDVTQADIANITDPENWILQRKVDYEPVVKSPDGYVKTEIRLLYIWPDGEEPQLCINLARLSRGKMIGVRYNADFDWVGGTVGLMAREIDN
ncbi:hypothetical protein TH53_17695 [Pedobacter lusitanus]|uniref:Circularly permuted ATPgrasp domain-containing protein n=1 Tax=Pedobacter lusitanus TaxID=1503925 RepID=A0A0D0GN96_9SPHI|nr:hypothetical protein [Pedobacter lusitanus]KIO75901.1 hypothetical protein TH53_17695 [Pedobacter lusitanus]